jgi:hypothetical protein
MPGLLVPKKSKTSADWQTKAQSQACYYRGKANNQLIGRLKLKARLVITEEEQIIS